MNPVARIDRALLAIPMFRLALLQLAALAVVAVLAAIPGWVPYSPLFLIADLAVAVGVAWLGNQVMSALARTAPHGESALITGLILFFLVSPPQRAEDLATTLSVLAVACLVAMASKQLLVVGGRHVLNPAATGAFVVGIAGLTTFTTVGIGWWVATAALLPFVAVLGLVLLVRVRLLGPALVLVAVAVGVAWLGNQVMSALARTPPHGESALITGLILFFLVSPPQRAEDLATTLSVLAVACLVATASKQLLVVGGRHVLNPAATGAFVIGIAGLTAFTTVGVGWWVATAALLPFVAVLGLVLLVRVRLLGPAVVLVAIAALLETLGQVRYGSAAGAALATAFVSTPIVFLAAYMFSEPITLPPRRWQRYVEAAVIGVVLAVPYLAPFRLLTLYPSPELALLVGNVFALVVARPVGARMRLAGRRQVSPTAVEYAFRPERAVVHRAGQYLELQVPHRGADARGIRRTLTIVSPPGDPSGEVRVAIRSRDPRSSFKRALDVLAVGAPVRAVTVSGGFTLPDDRSLPLLLVASGIGITPFVSQLEHEAALVAAGARPRDVLVVDRVPSADEIPYADVLESSGARVLLVVPRAADLAGVPLPDHWHVSEHLDAAALAGVLPDPAVRRAYVSGSPSFVHDARAVLRRAGVRRIRTDSFAGY